MTTIIKNDISQGIKYIENRKIKLMPLIHIERFEGYCNYSFIHTNSGQKIKCAKTLKRIEEIINSNNFIRVHKGHLINILCINRLLLEDKKTQVELNSGVVLDISRRRTKEIKIALSIFQ